MKSSLRQLLIITALLLPLLGSMECNGEQPAPTPEQIEELRQKQIRQSESFHNDK